MGILEIFSADINSYLLSDQKPGFICYFAYPLNEAIRQTANYLLPKWQGDRAWCGDC